MMSNVVGYFDAALGWHYCCIAAVLYRCRYARLFSTVLFSLPDAVILPD